MERKISPMYMVVTIVERGKGLYIINKYQEFKILHHLQAAGHGTAASHLLDALGFGTGERDIVLSFAPRDTVNQLMYYLKDEDRSSLGAPGIAVSLPMDGMTAIWAAGLDRLSAVDTERGEILMEQEKGHSLILIAVNQGYTDMVMDTARAAGARGGTVIRARWAGSGGSQKFAGITIQTEKEILAIVAPEKDKQKIMDEINRTHGMKSSAQGMLISVPAEHTVRLD